MFRWINKRRKEQSLFSDLMASAAEGAQFDQLLAALVTLGVNYDPKENESALVSGGACALLNSVRVASDLRNEDQEVISGLFLLAFCNQFSRLSQSSFEASSLVALVATFGAQAVGGRIPSIISQYNEMTADKSKTIIAIGLVCSRWISEPTEESTEALRELYRIVCQSVQETQP